MRRSIVTKLLAAFLLVSLLPIGVLAYLSSREGEGEEAHAEAIAGVPIATIELAVAAAGLALSIGMALFLGRTLVRPLRRLEREMSRVERGDLSARADVSSADELGQLAFSFNRMVEGLEREVLLRDLLGQYLSPELARAAIEQRGRLDGQVVTCTALFADIRNFTGLTEALPPETLISLLNRYFARVSSAIVAEGGLVNKFGGDSVLAVFGTPLNPAPDHACLAVQAGMSILRELEEFNREQADARLPEVMIGVGIATGDVVAGNLGGAGKVEYTVIGDAVNVASRLQALTKELGEPMLVSASTAEASSQLCRVTPIGDVDVRGRAESVAVFRAQPPMYDISTLGRSDVSAERSSE
jgi:adenylate cyclase